MKKTLALLLVACMVLTMVPFMAFASSAATVDVYFTDDSGNKVNTVNPGDSVWATIALSDYESLVGEANYAAGEIDKAIAVATTYLTLDGLTVAVNEDGSPVWDSAIAGIADNGGSLAYNLDDDVAKFVLESDNKAGTAYAIDLTDLNAAAGELYKVKLTVNADAVNAATATLYKGDAGVEAGIALVTKAADDADFTPSELATEGYGKVCSLIVKAKAPEVAEPGNYHLINQMEGLTVADWTGVKVSGDTVEFSSDAAKGSFKAYGKGFAKSRIEYSASKFALGQGNFTFSAKFSQGGDKNNSFQPYSYTKGNTWDNLYYGIDVGGLELRMLAYSIPVLYYNGTFIAAGKALVEPMYEFDYSTGKFKENDDGKPVVAKNSEGTALYANHGAYKDAVKAAKLFWAGKSTLTLKVEGNTVIGQLIDGAGIPHELLTAALPAGALAEPAAVAVTFSNVNWYSYAVVYGADLVSDKLIVTPAPSISAPTFSADEWTIEVGRSGQGDSAYNASIEDTKIITGNSSYLITNNNTYTGDKFLLTYSARKRDYGNMSTSGIGAAMQVGDLYFGLNNGRMTPFVMYNGEIIYQSDKNIYEYVVKDTALINHLNDLEIKGNNGRANTWTRKEGKATYTAKFDNGRFVMTYESSNYGKAEIVNIDVSAYVTSFTDAAVSIKGSVDPYDSCDYFELVNLVYSDETFDIGYLNAVVGSMADYADYNNYPAEFKQLVTISRFVPDSFKSFITNLSVVEAYDANYNAYQKLGSVNVTVNAETINLFDFNTQLGTLADADFSAGYSDLAAKADIVLRQLSQDQLSAMYNISVYEKYKADYAAYLANLAVTSKNIIFDYASGLYQNEFVTPVDGANYARNDTYPTGAFITTDNKQTVSATFKNRLYTDDYFVISAKGAASYNRHYNEYAVGELAVRLVYDDNNNTQDNDKISIVIFMNGTEIYRKYTGLSNYYMGCQWYVKYDKGVMTVTYLNGVIKEADTVNLTALDGWDENYTPNGKQVTVTVKSTYNNPNSMPKISNFSIKARANADMFEAFNALALTDVAAAKNIYETLPESANEFITAEALAAVNGDFSLVTENTTVTSDIDPYRYGDTVTFTANVDTNKYDFDGWYNAEGNRVSQELSYTATILPNMTLKAKAVGLRFEAASLTLEDNLSLNFKVPSSLFDEGKYTEPFVEFKINDYYETVREYTVSGEYYVFTFTNIAPQEMNDTVTATLYAKDYEGTLCSSKKSLRARDYCYYQLNNNSENETLRKLIVDLLNYGAEAQKYTSYNTGALVNKDLTSDQAAWGTTSDLRTLYSVKDTKYAEIPNPSVTWKAAGLKLDDSVVMRFTIQTDDIFGLTVKVTDEKTGDVLDEIIDFKATGDDGFYYVYFDGFNAGQMSESVLVTVYNNIENVPVSHTIRYSIESYAYSKLKTPGSNVNLENLLTAMMKYGDAAAAYKRESLS